MLLTLIFLCYFHQEIRRPSLSTHRSMRSPWPSSTSLESQLYAYRKVRKILKQDGILEVLTLT